MFSKWAQQSNLIGKLSIEVNNSKCEDVDSSLDQLLWCAKIVEFRCNFSEIVALPCGDLSCSRYAVRPQQFLNFFPLPHGHGSFRPTFGISILAS